MLVVLVVVAVAGLAVSVLVRGVGGRTDGRVSSAAVEIDGLFTPARRHTAEYFHAVEMRREDVTSPDGGPGGLRDALREAIEDRAHRPGPRPPG